MKYVCHYGQRIHNVQIRLQDAWTGYIYSVGYFARFLLLVAYVGVTVHINGSVIGTVHSCVMILYRMYATLVLPKLSCCKDHLLHEFKSVVDCL